MIKLLLIAGAFLVVATAVLFVFSNCVVDKRSDEELDRLAQKRWPKLPRRY